MTFFRVGRAAVADEQVIVLRLPAGSIDELIVRPARDSIDR